MKKLIFFFFLICCSSCYSQHLPVDNIVITSNYGKRFHPITKKNSFHNGIDLKCFFDKVYAPLKGVVIESSSDKFKGNYLIILSGQFKFHFYHLYKTLLKKGDYVSSGQIIACCGDSGISTNPHLHFGVEMKDKFINPISLINKLQ